MPSRIGSRPIFTWGRHAQLVGELQTLVREHPLRERPAAQLMLALYRSGRQAEALEVYRETRVVLNRELGIDPSSSLQRLEGEILHQDPGLDWRPPPSEPTATEPSPPPSSRVVLGAIVGVLAAALAAISLIAISRDEPSLPSSIAPGRIDALTSELKASIPTAGVGAGAPAWADGSLWVANTISGTVARIDPDRTRCHRACRPTGLRPISRRVRARCGC